MVFRELWTQQTRCLSGRATYGQTRGAGAQSTQSHEDKGWVIKRLSNDISGPPPKGTYGSLLRGTGEGGVPTGFKARFRDLGHQETLCVRMEEKGSQLGDDSPAPQQVPRTHCPDQQQFLEALSNWSNGVTGVNVLLVGRSTQLPGL